MKKLLISLLLISFSAMAKDYNPTCSTYNSKLKEIDKLKVTIKNKQDEIKTYEKTKYNKPTIKALKKELKTLRSSQRKKQSNVKNSKSSLKSRIKLLKKNFNSNLKTKPEDIIAKCIDPAFDKTQFSKMLLDSVSNPVSPSDDSILLGELASCQEQLQNAQNQLSGTVIDGNAESLIEAGENIINEIDTENSDQ
ncbi:MAG: gas vesicle protein [Thermoproteota archaeon]|jgi:gas vesicle protein